MKRRGGETEAQSFSGYADAINETPDLDLPDPKSVAVEVPLLVEEAKISCTTGMGTPSDIAKVVAFLASDDSGWLTGEVVLASGGLR